MSEVSQEIWLDLGLKEQTENEEYRGEGSPGKEAYNHQEVKEGKNKSWRTIKVK